ncbi:uncharacterized protein BP5553_09986 [Venustampulla echinocandica]|uniref:Uncharacterized protein n=1 Tax=Venustampulla echinocandica TaxID=2656787 RepID=A0A370TB97_9HELO|nr:uncharacterized protein BP5553_09986 [Venustampulla echinocandica]RDL31197.1 hypothetical protein BP5553_09986 [Venustampulla echinocandica]
MAFSIKFVNRDNYQRTVCWFPERNHSGIKDNNYPDIPGTIVPGRKSVTVGMPDSGNHALRPGWVGAFRTIFDGGDPFTPAVRGEVNFEDILTWYDISMVDNNSDNSGVHWLYPISGNDVHHGCTTFPCSNAFSKPGEAQTQVTNEHDLECLIGG